MIALLSVVDLAKLNIYEGSIAADVTLEIDDDDMVNVGLNKITYAELIDLVTRRFH